MPIADSSPSVVSSPTDAVVTARILRNLIRSVQSCRQLVQRTTQLIGRAPGGKAGILSELGADQAEAVAMLTKLTTFINDHKASDADEVVNPLA